MPRASMISGWSPAASMRLISRIEAAGDQPEIIEALGIDWALTQIRDLLAHGAPGYHLYILNRARSALILAAGLAA